MLERGMPSEMIKAIEMPLEKVIQKRAGDRSEPSRIEIAIKDGETQVAYVDGWFGSPGMLSKELNAEFAYGLADIISEEKRGPIGVIYGLEVDEGYRRRGIGSDIVQEMMDLFAENKVRRVYVQASPEMGPVPEEVLMAFYTGLGFEYCCRTGDAADDPVFMQDARKRKVN